MLPICPAGGLVLRGSEAQGQVMPGPYLGPTCNTLTAMAGGTKLEDGGCLPNELPICPAGVGVGGRG